MASSSVSSSPSTGVRLWRTAFLTLRDETLNSPPPATLLRLIRILILSHSHDVLVGAALDMPPHEVASDVLLLAELALAAGDLPGVVDSFIPICHLIHEVSFSVHLEINSSSWTIILDFLEKMVECFLGKAHLIRACPESIGMNSIAEITGILRLFVLGYGRNSSSSLSIQLVRLLLHVLSCLHGEFSLSQFCSSHKNAADIGITKTKFSNIWEVQTIALNMIEDAFSRIGSSISLELWQSTIEILRKEMDSVASTNSLLEGNDMRKFYTALLRCLHLVLSVPKGSLSEHVVGFAAALQMFFVYGLHKRSPLVPRATDSEKKLHYTKLNSRLTESGKSEHRPYRPPHLRKREGTGLHLPNVQSSLEYETSKLGFTSSDSEQNDSDGSTKDEDHFRSSKARAVAIICVKDLCQADPKSLASLWTMLLPTNDVLQPRKYQATIMTCLLFDPVLKIRTASVTTLAAMLDVHSSKFLQIAEYKESNKCGSFTTLSTSIGQILMQIHRGILHLVQHETNSGLQASSLKVLMLLIAATPYARMPDDLLPSVILTIQTRISEGFSSKPDQISLTASALSCLGAALSISPPSLHVSNLLEKSGSTGSALTQGKLSILDTLFQYAQDGVHLTLIFEALQALRSMSHNYPNVVTASWDRVSAVAHGLLQISTLDDPSYELLTTSTRGDIGNSVGSSKERCTTAAIKVLDECLRAASGFKGTDDLLECKLLDIQLISDCTRSKRVSSAPSYELGGLGFSKGCSEEYSSGIKQWFEVTEKHLPLALSHNSPMIRGAAVTCFAGMTSSVFFSLAKDAQNFVISSAITAALNDKVPSVRSAACRAVGVIACFPKIFCSPKILEEFIYAIEFNTHDPLVSVRITSSWALANICDSLRHRATDSHLENFSGQVAGSKSISDLFESALRLTKDGDKIKSNAVRALGNLSRFVRFTHHSGSLIVQPNSIGDPHWPERMVQAFVSCVTTGNVKVQWNVCHALGNFFLNESLNLQDMPWASSVYSILLLLLRDSTNFKIRIHAAVALAVPASRIDYGCSFSDVVHGLEHVIESLGSEQPSTPSSFKYKTTLEKQLALTTLHVLGFLSSRDDQALKVFLIKKANFLEEWLKSLYQTLSGTLEASMVENEEDGSVSSVLKKTMISKAAGSLLDIYKSSNQPSVVRRFQNLVDGLP